MTTDQLSIPDILDHLLPVVKFEQLSMTAGVAYFYLLGVADRTGNGYINYALMAMDLGREQKCCRECLKSLKRNGLVEGANADGHGGAMFQLVLPGADSAEPPV